MCHHPLLSHLLIFCHGKQLTYRRFELWRQDKQLVANSQKIRQEISKGRFRISRLAFADFEFKQSPDLEPGTRFFRKEKRRVLVLS